MKKSVLREYKLYEDINASSGTKVAFKMTVVTDNTTDAKSVSKVIIDVINKEVVDILNKAKTKVALKPRQDKNGDMSTVESKRYVLAVKSELDTSSVKVVRKKKDDKNIYYDVTFTVSISPIKRQKLVSDTLAKVGNMALNVVSNTASAANGTSAKMTSPYSN